MLFTPDTHRLSCLDVEAAARDDVHAVVEALTIALDAKHPYTSGHSERVANLSALIAGNLGYGLEECRFIHVAGHLHDIGKIGVPDAVLLKDSSLTDEEFASIRRHPELGFEILSKVTALRPFASIVRHHHERWDGRGYPDGLSGAAIPRFSRIIALADAYDAMTSNRAYRLRLSPEAALREIERGSGSQFEPEAAAAFLDMVRAGAVA